MFSSKLWILFLSIMVSASDWGRDVFYQEINRFRASPLAYQQEHGIKVRCTAPLDETYPTLQIHPVLENSSYFQASTLSSLDCPIVSHDTCYLYCQQFGGCTFLDRVGWFLHNVSSHNALEILMMGPKDPHKILYNFLGSERHCNHILNCHINSIGFSFVHIDRNIFVADLAYIH